MDVPFKREVTVVRAITPQLHGAITRLVEMQFGDEYDRSMPIEQMQSLAMDGTKFIICAFADSAEMPGLCERLLESPAGAYRQLAGIGFAAQVRTLSRTVLYYEDMIVDPRFRCYGFGSMIDKKIIDLATEQRCDCIELLVPAAQSVAQRMRLNSGFTFRNKIAMGKILIDWKRKPPLWHPV